jgi:hypothetical protein
MQFAQFIGLNRPTSIFTTLQFLVAILLILVYLITIIHIVYRYINHKNVSQIGTTIVFFTISILAIFGAGIAVIKVRAIYFFCWYLLIAFCCMYLVEITKTAKAIRLSLLNCALIFAVLFVSAYNYVCTFVPSFRCYSEDMNFKQSICSTLESYGIRYVYSDWQVELHSICALSNDRIVYGTFSLSDNINNKCSPVPYLHLDDWFKAEHYDASCILFSDSLLKNLERNYSAEYYSALMENLELIGTHTSEYETIYIYRCSPQLFEDMIS